MGIMPTSRGCEKIWMNAQKDKQLGSFIDMKVVKILKADLGIYYMSGTGLGMNWPIGTLQFC